MVAQLVGFMRARWSISIKESADNHKLQMKNHFMKEEMKNELKGHFRWKKHGRDIEMAFSA